MQTETHEINPTEHDIITHYRKLTPQNRKALFALLVQDNPKPLLLVHQNIDQVQDLVRVLVAKRIE